MEVDQDQRITAQDALGHIWISGNAASEKNLKDGVCAQMQKNFAKAKWRKAIRVTTFMQRLRAPDHGSGRLPVTPRSSMSVSHEVTIETSPSELSPGKDAPGNSDAKTGKENGQPSSGIVPLHDPAKKQENK
nr:PREDICTED: caM kinase-like vesicle-associated protein [Latimeria chalumnae]|eukprot:XP_006004026.1 PREDICTED: caM kinase-like vesicle-associated protein [Latimeria chalumnae]